MGAIFTNIAEIFAKSGWAQIFFTEGGWKYAVMLAVACVLLYLAIVKQFEPLLLLPIGFGMLMTNLPPAVSPRPRRSCSPSSSPSSLP